MFAKEAFNFDISLIDRVSAPGEKKLSRSQTFSSGGVKSSPRRKLPQIPTNQLSSQRENLFVPRDDNSRQINLLNSNIDRKSSLGYYHSLGDKHSLDYDSGYPSCDASWEETSVDAPNLLPRRNSSNFLWVGFDQDNNNSNSNNIVTRRPKNHERLSNNKKSKRHSAPPGSLDSVLLSGDDKSGLLVGVCWRQRMVIHDVIEFVLIVIDNNYCNIALCGGCVITILCPNRFIGLSKKFLPTYLIN